MKSSKRSIAMKKSWAERRNSPGRKLARERANSLGDKLDRQEFSQRKGSKKVTQRVTDNDLQFIGTYLAQLSQAQNEIRSMIAVPPRAQGNVRRMIATRMLQGMLSSIPITDRTKVQADVWAAKAYEFADALIAAEDGSPPLGTGNKQGVWVDRAYLRGLELNAGKNK